MFFEVQDLTKTYIHNGHRFAAVDHLSFFSFTWRNSGCGRKSGSGKSTLCRLICQFARADSGHIFFTIRISPMFGKRTEESVPSHTDGLPASVPVFSSPVYTGKKHSGRDSQLSHSMYPGNAPASYGRSPSDKRSYPALSP